jgi:E3 ubiquitin-protein ligase Mdm2
VHGSKDKCIKCNMDRDGNSLDTSDIEDDNLCVICLTQPKNTLFLHAKSNDGHQSCCYECAHKIFTTSKKCPICRQTIKNIYKIFKS